MSKFILWSLWHHRFKLLLPFWSIFLTSCLHPKYRIMSFLLMLTPSISLLGGSLMANLNMAGLSIVVYLSPNQNNNIKWPHRQFRTVLKNLRLTPSWTSSKVSRKDSHNPRLMVTDQINKFLLLLSSNTINNFIHYGEGVLLKMGSSLSRSQAQIKFQRDRSHPIWTHRRIR